MRVGLLILMLMISGCTTHDSDKIIASAESKGFTHQQALFLRYGPFQAVTLCMNSFPELQCRFFAEEQSKKITDDEFNKDCTSVGFNITQCNLFRFGV